MIVTSKIMAKPASAARARAEVGALYGPAARMDSPRVAAPEVRKRVKRAGKNMAATAACARAEVGAPRMDSCAFAVLLRRFQAQ